MAKLQLLIPRLGAAVVLGLLMSGGFVASAQDESAPSHPSFIESGDCSNLDANPMATLNNVELIGTATEDDDSSEEEDRQVEGTLTAAPVLTSNSEDLDLSFDDMLAESHSVTVHLSDDDLQTYVACGEIGGLVVDDQMVIALHEVDGSGYNGIAMLAKDGDGNVDVTIYLAGPAATDSESDATPAG